MRDGVGRRNSVVAEHGQCAVVLGVGIALWQLCVCAFGIGGSNAWYLSYIYQGKT